MVAPVFEQIPAKPVTDSDVRSRGDPIALCLTRLAWWNDHFAVGKRGDGDD